MSNLSFENIDRWLFEYTEGNLSSSQVDQLENFIFLHPELNIDLDAWKSAKVEKDNVAFDALAYQQSAPIIGAIWGTTAFSFLIFTLVYAMAPSLFSVKSKYELDTIDVAFIMSSENEESKNDIRLASNTKSPENELIVSENSSFNNTITSNSIDSHYTSNNEVIVKNSIAITNSELKSKTENINLSEVLTHQIQTDTKKAPKLNDVIAHLNKDFEKVNTKSNEKSSSSKKSSSYKGRRMNLKKRFSSMARQLKKMADQPVALRNSKDPHFHAPFMTGYNANFGMVGTLMRNRFQSTSRNQWVGNENQQLMNMISWDNYIYQLRGGLGIDVSYSTYGNGGLENYNAAVTYSPKFSLSNNVSLEPALRFKTGMTSLDNQSDIIGRDIEFTRNHVQSIFGNGETPIGSQLWYRDIGLGMLLNTKWFYAGINMDNVNRHYSNYYSADLNADHRASHHFTSVIGTEYTPVGKDITYSAYALHQKFGELNEVWFGGNLQWNWLQLGAGMNNHRDIGGSFGFTFDQFTLMYNLDYVKSQLFDRQQLSHQITMRVLLRPNRFAAKYLLN
jgi:hypothetical protein